MCSYADNYGTYNHSLYSNNTAILLECSKHFDKAWGMDISLSIAADFGRQFGNQLGAMITIKKQGIITEKAILKKSIKPVLKSKRWKLVNFVKKAKISKETFEKAERGQEISLATAEKICNPLGIKVKDYFDIVTTRKPFAKATIVLIHFCES